MNFDDYTGTNAEIAVAVNASPTRYASTRINAEAVVSLTGSTDATNAIYAALLASSDTTLVRAANAFETVGIDVGNPVMRGLISSLGIDESLVATLLGLATDTHGGDVTEQDVADDKAAKIEESRVIALGEDMDAARAAANAAVLAGGSYAEAKAAWDAELNERSK